MTRSQVLDRPQDRTVVTARRVRPAHGHDVPSGPVPPGSAPSSPVPSEPVPSALTPSGLMPPGLMPPEPVPPEPVPSEPVPSEPVPVAVPDALGDDAFTRTLYERHGTVLLSFAVQLCGGDRYRAEDVVQETAVRAWQHRRILDPTTDRVRTWLFTVAHRLVIDHHRARQARPKEVADEPEEPAVPDPSDRLVTLRAVLGAMTELTVPQREALIYTYYFGYSVEQTAAVLGLAPGTVKSRVHYAMRALRASLRAQAVMD
jgi:RNA polymerase sigma-70 factor (ECF subfamily)